MDEITKDSRFSHISKDPRFKKLPKKHVKVKIDKRFQSMFNEKKFQIKNNVDKRGRKVKLGDTENLKRFYELSGSDEESDDENDKEKKSESCSDSEEEKIEEKSDDGVPFVTEKDKKGLTPEIKKKLRDITIDYARGEGAVFSESSSDEDSSDVEEDEEVFNFDHDWGELDKDAESTDTATSRLAVCNMNWDRIEAADLMVLFNSFLPPGGLIHSVTIYPSEFGLQRLKEEEEKGPLELTESMPEGEEEELNLIQMEKLRKYQLNRLKYYYAVVVCDSPATADVLYKECDGLEYESSSSKLDLRFIPDDTTFDQEPKESCTSLPNLSTYKPKLFMTSALTKAKCDLTWDENDPNREEIVKSIHSGNVDETHLKKYLAYSSSDDSEEEEESKEKTTNTNNMDDISKYKSLLAEIENKEKNSKKNEINLEVSWNLKLENKASEKLKEVDLEKEKKTPFEQFLEKRKNKKKKKKEERMAQLNEENKSDESAFSNDEIPSDIDLNDPYFKEEFESFKNKKSSKTKKNKQTSEEDDESKQKKAELELLLLDNDPENLKHFSLKKIEESEKASKKKRKLKKRKAEETFQDDFKIDVNDERFSALYTSHHFNIDPADPQFKATKATKELIEEKLRRREVEDRNEFKKENLKDKKDGKSQNGPKNAELSVLVKKVKKNTSEVYKKARRL